MKMFSIYESSNTHHPWEDLYAPAYVDVVLQGQRDRRVFLYLFPIGLFHLCRRHVRRSRQLCLNRELFKQAATTARS